ncbi:MAG: prolipoprotein diacylglyceryl transferase, partial [Woeseiaceae bacterium]|nr:prolipoprotein diacylglyceryl transferase [Woeseiaceae bacterium]
GLAGVMVAMWLFSRKIGAGMWRLWDFVAPLAPLGLFFGRVGNFINGELWGKPTDVPWAFRVGDQVLHPSMLYEAILEGLVLFAILWLYSAKPRPAMSVSGLFLFFYGLFRFLVEFVRVPDEHIGYLAFGWFTMGQALSLPMILAGAAMFALAHRRDAPREATT